MSDPEQGQWWGPVLFVAAVAIANRRQRDDARRRENNKLVATIVVQARYLHALRGAWPVSISTPSAPPTEYVRVPVFPMVSGRFSATEMDEAAKYEIRDIRIGMVRNSDGFWSAEFADRREPVMFWPAPSEAPKWWEAR